MKLYYYRKIVNENKYELCTIIDADYKTHSVKIENFTDDLIFRAFGVREKVTWEEYNNFLESRCFPRTRANVKWLLDALGLGDIGYEPIEIIKKTGGIMAEDTMYLTVEE